MHRSCTWFHIGMKYNHSSYTSTWLSTPGILCLGIGTRVCIAVL